MPTCYCLGDHRPVEMELIEQPGIADPQTEFVGSDRFYQCDKCNQSLPWEFEDEAELEREFIDFINDES